MLHIIMNKRERPDTGVNEAGGILKGILQSELSALISVFELCLCTMQVFFFYLEYIYRPLIAILTQLTHCSGSVCVCVCMCVCVCVCVCVYVWVCTVKKERQSKLFVVAWVDGLPLSSGGRGMY